MKRLLAVFFGIVIGWSGIARPELLQLYSSPNASDCFVADPGPGGAVTVFVALKFTTGATGVSFSAPVPPYSGLQFVGDVLPAGFTEVGNSQTHADLSFGTCLAGSLNVMEIHFVRVGNAEPCIPYAIQPGSSMLDCSFAEKTNIDSEMGVALNASGPCSYPYRHPFPADGAVNVPLSTVLDWISPGGVFSCSPPIAVAPVEAASHGRVFFGTTTNPPYDPSASYNHGVGPLSYGTTYYWRINADQVNAGPLWSFTTASIIATTPSTWGAIKALYR